VLGVDMAHVGRRYGHAERCGPARDRSKSPSRIARLDRICAGDAGGSSSLCTRLRPAQLVRIPAVLHVLEVRSARLNLEGEVLKYEQWNIDEPRS
jgi:hypothetical protein